MKGKWVRPVEVNDWEYIITYFDPDYTEDRQEQQKLNRLKEGVYEVRWPDGSITQEKVIAKNRTGSYWEQGDRWPTIVTSKTYFIEKNCNGAKSLISVSKVELYYDHKADKENGK